MAQKKMGELTLRREEAIKNGKIVVTKANMNSKLKMQLLKNYGLVIKQG